MNLRTTLALLALAAAGAVVWTVGPKLPGWLDPTPPAPPPADAGSLAVFHEQITPDKLKSVRIDRGKQTLLRLDRAEDGSWTLPGGWRTRGSEIDDLVKRLGSLHSRFAPYPLDGADLAKYGLDKPACVVTVRAGPTEYKLSFGEGKPEGGAFYRPTFVRLDDKLEAIRLGPGLLAVLTRPAEYYRQRRLFAAQRVPREPGSADKVERIDATRIEVKDAGKDGASFALEKGKHGWQVDRPSVDRLDPDQGNRLLEAVADLWADRFVRNNPLDVASGVGALGQPETGTAGPLTALAQAPQAPSPEPLALRTGIDKAEKVITVFRGKDKQTLLIGNVSRTAEKPANPLAPPDMPPPPGGGTEYRYARLENNPQVFELRTDKLKDVFVAASTLRDPKVVRFADKDVQGIKVWLGPRALGKESLVLSRDNKDRWQVETPGAGAAQKGTQLAEEKKVGDLLSGLSGLSGQEKETDAPVGAAALIGSSLTGAFPGAASIYPDRLRNPDAPPFDRPLATVVLTVTDLEAKPGPDGKKPTREVVLHVGRDDPVHKQLLVRVDDWPRAHRVEDGVLKLLRRPALAYRGRLLDFAVADVGQLVVEQGGKKLALSQDDSKWRMTAPAAVEVDPGKATQLADTLGKLEPAEYVTENPTADELENFGLNKPALTATVQYKGQLKSLRVGKPRGSAERYARLEGAGSVFVIGQETYDGLSRDAKSYAALGLWKAEPSAVSAVRVEKEGAEPYTLERKDGAWRLAVPFNTAAQEAVAGPLVDVLAG